MSSHAPRVTVLVDRWRAHPLAWIHRAEARAIVQELRSTGRSVSVRIFRDTGPAPPGPLLLRLSDPEMCRAADVLGAAGRAYRGPSAAAMARCYDKWAAHQAAAASGIECPPTRLAALADELPRPLVLKPRRGSDSLGLRIVRGAVPGRLRNDATLAQPQIVGAELTVGVIEGLAGMPLRLDLPPGTPYTFLRKYLLRPGRKVLTDQGVREAALRVASVLGVDWAARVDFIRERATGKLMFLECDVAPLVGPQSAFAASLAAAGMERAEQLARLLGEPEPKWRAGMGS
jgi:D-alanine-D-alanine ligase-like ATP-grasp enzyme